MQITTLTFNQLCVFSNQYNKLHLLEYHVKNTNKKVSLFDLLPLVLQSN